MLCEQVFMCGTLRVRIGVAAVSLFSVFFTPFSAILPPFSIFYYPFSLLPMDQPQPTPEASQAAPAAEQAPSADSTSTTTEPWHKPVTTITPFSRALAWVLFIGLPIVGFVFGMNAAPFFGEEPTPEVPVPILPAPQPSEPQPLPEPEPQPSEPYTTMQADDSGATEAGVASAVAANNEFTFDLYRDLVTRDTGNLFFSPYSMSTALAMVYEGAEGETAAEIADVFGFASDDAERRSSMARLYNTLNKTDAPYALKTANALWVQQDYSLLPSYTDAVATYYGGRASNVDFKLDTEGARQTINTWVAERTENKIQNLFESGTLTPLTRLVLTNTIYFKGDWLTQFDAALTTDEPFFATAGETIMAPLMQHTGEGVEYRYAQNEEVQLLELPYKGEELSMLAILPSEIEGRGPDTAIYDLEDSLSVGQLQAWTAQLYKQRVDVFLPKFTMETKYTLNDSLKALGMPTAFDENFADFSGMSGARDLFIGLVVHQAFVEVNEEGTEAAAATGVVMVGNSMPVEPEQIPEFRADRPFLFLIRENATGAILFVGRVMDPMQG